VNQSKFWVSALSVLVVGALAVFIISKAAHDRRDQSFGVPTQTATKFKINPRGLAIPTSTNYVYRVVGPKGTTARITYTEPDGESGNLTGAAMPWSIAIPAPASAGPDQQPYVQANTNAQSSNARVTCQAFQNGKLIDQETATGSYSVVYCGFPYG
jgi:hypothetical protein